MLKFENKFIDTFRQLCNLVSLKFLQQFEIIVKTMSFRKILLYLEKNT